ncbi:LysR family nod box-dependent transcriptional activator [Variovorax boronicumulans]|uniref:LysR family transcriptional regulator n=1 Tax=Variovorax boronicumulans TaxID=436515 RepID=UPI0024733CBB|nr:LysR family transcriptional regulator [Variovorax boronicumulans]MDH6167901.1 LysR family nod box-dependent transcriptional activator [Variovorax boronicumulans]
MRFQKLDLNLLVALDALLRERSISRAAEQLHLSQSAMSSALARLRTYFGDDLLVPVGRKLELTSRAEVLKEAVRDVLMRVDTAIAAAPEFNPSESDRNFQLIVSDYTAITLIPHVLALAQKQSRTVRFDLIPLLERPQRALENGEADLLVIPRSYGLSDHPAETLFEEGFCCAVWNESRFARSVELTAKQYETAGHVVVQPADVDKPTPEDGLIQLHGNARRVEATTFSFMGAPYLVVGTDRIATMRVRLARIAQRSLPITLLPLPMPIPLMQQTQQWHKHRTRDPGLVWLRGLMHEAVLRMDAEPDQAPPG